MVIPWLFGEQLKLLPRALSMTQRTLAVVNSPYSHKMNPVAKVLTNHQTAMEKSPNKTIIPEMHGC